mgnify:CR=1 FL=1
MLSSCQSQKTVTETKNTETSKLTDQQLMDKVQKDALKYFWDYAEPNSMLGRERYHEDDIYPDKDKHVVTTGGSGFGLMALVSGMSQGYITKEQGVERLNKIADFLGKADRFHGAWAH